MLPRSAANATKPVSYRQRGETGHSPRKGWAVDHRWNPSDRLGTGTPPRPLTARENFGGQGSGRGTVRTPPRRVARYFLPTE